jgi:hypothetical protein
MAQGPKRTARRVPASVPAARIPGGPTPASVAATAPGAGAHHGESALGGATFYSPSAEAPARESPAAVSGLEAVAQADANAFNDSVRRDHQGEGEHGGTADREVVEHVAAETIDSPDALAAEIERIRGFRRPLGAFSQKLALAKRPGYHRHWFNDVAGRIDEASNNGWSPVLGRDKKPIARCVGTGRDSGALYAFAMEIPEVFWLEDQSAKHQVAQDRIDGLKGAGAFRAQTGAAEKSDKGKFYDPVESPDGPLSVVKG